MPLHGLNIVAGERIGSDEMAFAEDPATGERLSPGFAQADRAIRERATQAAAKAADVFAETPDVQRAAFLRAIADRIDADLDRIVERGQLETALPEARIRGEAARTVGQLRAFADFIEPGNWRREARLDPDPERKPVPRPRLHLTDIPLGPVVVFGASNFPLAYSVAGGDTASALAAGCPVIVKAHPAHPGTGEIVAEAVTRAVIETDLPRGVFSYLHGGAELGTELAADPHVQAIGFTGSRRAGDALARVAAKREAPIPVFAEMGSTNPVFYVSGDVVAFAAAYVASLTLGGGQFCTNPGVLVTTEAHRIVPAILERMLSAPPGIALTRLIAANYGRGLAEWKVSGAIPLCEPELHARELRPALYQTSGEDYFRHAALREEVFGPAGLILEVKNREEVLSVARRLAGQLTGTIWTGGGPMDRDLERALSRRVGRLIHDGMPTGVEVSPAMNHGGPYPASSDSRFSAVGTHAITRWVRPLCRQGEWD
jgi:NADP-dependent aldehyde dehydrogenase